MRTVSTITFSIFALALLSPSAATPQNNAANNATLNVKITNTPLPVTAAAPLPVTVVAPVVPATVTCSMQLATVVGSGPFNVYGQTGFFLACPQGVDSISVSRVIYYPDHSDYPSNVAGYRLLLGLSDPADPQSVPNPTIIAMLTEGAPDVSLRNPLSISVNQKIAYDIACFSGIATVAATCQGRVFFIGTPK